MRSSWRRAFRRGVLLAASLGAAATLVGAASFALFTSGAKAQTDAFAAGTVILSSLSGNDNCRPGEIVIKNLEAGDSGTCTYKLDYSGSLNAWVALRVKTSSVSLRTYRPNGSATSIGGRALLDGGAGALSVQVTDTFNNAIGLPELTCRRSRHGRESCKGPVVNSLLTHTGYAGNPNDQGNQPAGSWTPGLSDTVTVAWSLPMGSPNAYQGSRAIIRLGGLAVQASNNAGKDGLSPRAIVFDASPGDGPPPATLGPYRMLSFPLDPRGDGESVVGVRGPTGVVWFDQTMLQCVTPTGCWSGWSNGYTGDVYATEDHSLAGLSPATKLVITLPRHTGAFYFYALGNNFGTWAITATAQNGTTSGPIRVSGSLNADAQYYGFYGTGGAHIRRITVTTTSAADGFAVGEFGIARGS